MSRSIENRAGKFVLGFEDTTLEVDPAGGRATRFALGARNVLTGPDADPDNYGVSFWPSPQAGWGWPPDAEINHQPYRAEVLGDELLLSSGVGARSLTSVSKRFAVDSARRRIAIAYVLKNEATAPASWAPWEISRVHPRGLTFFPSGEGPRRDDRLSHVIDRDGFTWYQHDPANIRTNQDKYASDGRSGWLAHVDGERRLVYVKTFPDISVADQAPLPEGEVEIYGAPTYVEVEQQGPYRRLAPGETIGWQVNWYLRELPDGVAASVGSVQLIELIGAIVSGRY